MDLNDKYKEYFKQRKYLISVEPMDGYNLKLGFADKKNGKITELKMFNCTSLFTDGSVFEFIKNPDEFNEVKIIDGAIAWKRNGQVYDLCPDTCYVESTIIQ